MLTEEQVDIMKQIAEYVIDGGAISAQELNAVNTDLWRRGVMSLTAPGLDNEMLTMAKFLLRTA